MRVSTQRGTLPFTATSFGPRSTMAFSNFFGPSPTDSVSVELVGADRSVKGYGVGPTQLHNQPLSG